MIYYVTYSDNGTIKQQGQCQASVFERLKANITNILVVDQKISNLNEYKVENGQLVKQTPDNGYSFERFHNYPSIGHQLDCLYKDIQAGLFGDAAKTGQFANLISAVKQQYPKP